MDMDDRDLFLACDGMADGLRAMVMLAAVGGGLAIVAALGVLLAVLVRAYA